jgi:hypothetical protein
MNIVKNINQYNIDNIYFCDPIKNNVMTGGNFIRILCSTSNLVLNGILLNIPFDNVLIEKYYNKYKCSFDVNNYKDLINKLRNIEYDILNKYNEVMRSDKNKFPQYKIYEQIKNGNFKIFSENIDKINNIFLLKISGIWETETYFGLTYKFIRL